MLYLILLLCYDTLPPLPDLSELNLPEPALWIEPGPRALRIHGFGGQFYGADLKLDVGSFIVQGGFIRSNEWDNTDTGNVQICYSTALGHLWLKPNFRTRVLRRQDDYTQINPGMEFVVFTPPFIASGNIEYSRWLINEQRSVESAGEIDFTFDRTNHKPAIGMKGISTGGKIRPTLFARFNIDRFHIEFGSLAQTDPLSPFANFTYKTLWLEIGAAVWTGMKYNTLSSYFDMDIPVRYMSDIPAETLNMALSLSSQVLLHEQEIFFCGAYKKWHHRLDIGAAYTISSIQDVEEINLDVGARTRIRLDKVGLLNILHMQYNRADSTISFQPVIAVSDTLELNLGPILLAADIHYLSQRDGIEKRLPRSYVINTTAGVRISCTKIYVAIHNVTEQNSEIYDGYYYTGRQYAGGVEIVQRF
jgi:hypothetical protein